MLVRTKKQGAAASDLLTAQLAERSIAGRSHLGREPAVCAVVHMLAWLQRPVDDNAAIAAQSVAALLATEEEVSPFPKD